MIAGISLILNPRTPHAADMKEILRLFMEQHPLNPKADDFTQQEATIVSEVIQLLLTRQIATLHRRGLEVEARRQTAKQRRVNTSAERTQTISPPPKGRNGFAEELEHRASMDSQTQANVSSWQSGVLPYTQSPEDDRSQTL
jgi:hypothetical protein